MAQIDIFGNVNSTESLEKEIKEFNKKNKEHKIDLPKDGLDEKKIELYKTKLKEKQEEVEKDKEAKKLQVEKLAKQLQADKDYLEKEGINFDELDDKKITELAKETAKSPKFPFELRIYGDDKASEFSFESGKRYKLDELKKIIIKKYFELQKSSLEYDKERNSVYVAIKSSAKG